MRAFLASERQRIDRLLTRCAGLSVGVDEFLATEFFNRQAGRALILQPQGAFGYFYLPVAVFDDPGRRQTELRALIDLFTFWAMLRERGLILIAPDDPAVSRNIHFVGELFDHPKAYPAHLALNPQGDFSFQPEAIQDADNNVIFKGIRLSGDLYRLVQAQIGGTVFPSSSLVDMAVAWKIAPRPPPAPSHPSPSPPSPHPPDPTLIQQPSPPRTFWRAAGLVVLALAIGVGLWRLWGPWGPRPPSGPGVTVDSPQARDPIASSTGATPPLQTSQSATSPPPIPGTSIEAPPAPGMPTPANPPAPAPTPSPSAARTSAPQGIDLSKWNAQFLDTALASGQLSFVILRATDGTQPDPSFSALWARLLQDKLVRGAYHFYRAQLPAEAQAQAFLRAYGSPQPLQLPPIVDVEELSFSGLPPNPSVPELQQNLLSLLGLLQQATGRTPMVYTNANVGNTFLNDPRFGQYPLWVADWTSRTQPTLPLAWQGTGYRFWQRANQYTLPAGQTVPVDMDLFNGPSADLLALGAGPAAPARPADR